MPMSACCTKGKFYAKTALLYSKGGFYAHDFGIKPEYGIKHTKVNSHKGEILCQSHQLP